MCLGAHKGHDASPLNDAKNTLMVTIKDTREAVLDSIESSNTALAEYEEKVEEMKKKVSSLIAADKKLGMYL